MTYGYFVRDYDDENEKIVCGRRFDCVCQQVGRRYDWVNVSGWMGLKLFVLIYHIGFSLVWRFSIYLKNSIYV